MRTSRRFVLRACGIAIGAGFLFAGLAPEAQEKEPIKIGWIGPVSGALAPGGLAIQRGSLLAIDHINAAGGVDGRKLVLVPRDSEASPAKAVTVGRQLIDQEGVMALVGKYDSSSAKALNPVIHEGGVPMMISIAAATKNIEYERSPNFMFRTSGNDTYIAEFLVDFVAKELGAKRIAIGYEDTGYGFGGRDDITKALEGRGMKPVAAVKFSRPDTDMTAQALAVKQANADVIILYSIAKADAVLIRSLDKVGAKMPVVCAWAASSPELPQFAGPLANGVFVMQTYSFLSPGLDDIGKRVLADFMKKHGLKDPSEIVTPAFTAHAYDGMLLLTEAMRRAKLAYGSANLTQDRRKIRDALENSLGPVPGLIKTYHPAFSKDNHDSIGPKDYIMTVWQESKLIPYKGKLDWGRKG